MSIFGSNGFGSFIKCDGPRLAQTIVQQELFPKKKRKKVCDFKRSVSDSELKKGEVLCVNRMGGLTTITAYISAIEKLSTIPTRAATQARISASAKRLSPDSKTTLQRSSP